MARSPKPSTTVVTSIWKGKPMTFTYEETTIPELKRPGRQSGPNPHKDAIALVVSLKGQEKGARSMTVPAGEAFAHIRHLRNGTNEHTIRVEAKHGTDAVSTKDATALDKLPKDASVRLTFWAVDKVERKPLTDEQKAKRAAARAANKAAKDAAGK